MRAGRADSGFFADPLLEFLEARRLPYVIVARLSRNIKRQAAALCHWTPIDEIYAAREFTTQLLGWKKPRRFVVVRERIREGKSALGRKLIEVPGYTFRIFVTNRSEETLELWRDYNKRATIEQRIEQRIEELKAELKADGLCMKDFFATESAFLSVLFTFNLLSLCQKSLPLPLAPSQPRYVRPSFLGGRPESRCSTSPPPGAVSKSISPS